MAKNTFKVKQFPLYHQLDSMDCGPSCLRMVTKYHGRNVSLEYLREKSQYGRAGVSLLGVAEAAESIGFRAVGVKLTMEQLINDSPLPAIIHWKQSHFVVLYHLTPIPSPIWRGEKGVRFHPQLELFIQLFER